MQVIKLGKNFSKTLIHTRELCLVQFRTEWSGCCQIMQPVYEELAQHFGESVRFFSVDAEEQRALCFRYRIKELPTILIFKSNKLLDYLPGLVSKNRLIAKIEMFLKAN